MKKTWMNRVIQNVLISIPMAFAMVIVAQLVMIGHVLWGAFLTDYIIALCLAAVMGVLLPLPMAGVAFAKACRARPGSTSFRMMVTFVISFFLTLLMTFCMVMINVVIIQGLPMNVFFIGWGKVFAASFPVGFVMALILNPWTQRIADKIAGSKAVNFHETAKVEE